MDEQQQGTDMPPGGEPDWLRWFDELADLPPAERSARLAGLAGDQPELADRLERLFAAEEGAPQLLSRPVVERAPGLVAAALARDAEPEAPREELAPGTRVGPYRLLGLLGRGGMGEVYLAERADGVFEQRVALKLVKRGMDSEEIVRRFHRERQILARLEHPGIARIVDGGTAPDGRPYFVLELVEGEPILSHCRRTGLPLEDRLRLVIGACEAVDAAHRNLVVHRDLKPSNLLVTAEGQVKLLDFGIAKLLGEEAAGLTTQHERSLLTPAYAAPEQILGEPVTTATDVYALGVILYELLTGRSPHPRKRSLPAIQGEEGETMERPSAILRRATPDGEEDAAGIPDRQRFARRVQGDLDTVVLAALRRDPERRYRSAADLAIDLRRFLEGRPIQARADSVLYRARKLVLRHKLATAAIAAAILSLVAGFAISLREAEIARAQARRAERVKELLVSVFREADPQKGKGPNVTAGEILDAGARRVETEMGAEPEVQAELLDAIAQIQLSLGLFDPATEAAKASLAQRRKLFGANSAEEALSLTTLAEVSSGLGRLDEAQRLAEEARPAVERRFDPESPERQRLTLLRAFLFHHQGEREKAVVLAQELAESARRRFGPKSVETGHRLVVVAATLAGFSRFAEAEQAIREGLAILEASPEATPYQRAEARELLANLLEFRSLHQEAVTHYAAALDLQRAALGPKHVKIASTLIPYGYALSEMRRYPEAEKALREAIRILEPIDHYQIGSARNYLGFCFLGQERYAEAEQEFIAMERFLRGKVGADHPALWGARLSQGLAQLRLGRLEEAESTLSQVVAHFERNEQERDGVRSALKHLGEVARLRGRPAEALAMHRRARDIEIRLFGTTAQDGVAFSNYLIALDLLDLGDPESLAEARPLIDEAISFLRRSNAKHPTLDKFLLASGRIALAAGDRARARQDLAEAADRMRRHRGGDHPLTREAEALLRSAEPSPPDPLSQRERGKNQ
ncbi:MAG TPA: tetratricopeptide repeat protein [Thermoanaerobaculia bacterium]